MPIYYTRYLRNRTIPTRHIGAVSLLTKFINSKTKPIQEVNQMKKKERKNFNNMCNGGGIYCMGFIGAAIYYVSTTTGFWNGVLGVLKAMVWPAFLVYEVLKYINM